MPRLTFYPLGNADCCLIDLAGGEKIIFDFADMRSATDANDKRVDLSKALRDDLAQAKRKDVNVFCITHLDRDHINRSSEFFWLQHKPAYQGESRFKITELWVPAAVICDEDCDEEGQIWQDEARHRLRAGAGIRILSRPEVLQAWMKKANVDYEARKHLFVDAGKLMPTFTLAKHGVEFFVHSPFASRLEDGQLMDRNIDGVFMQATFEVGGRKTRVMLGADANHEVLSEIVRISAYHSRTERLQWDVFKLPHHCSYLSLGEDKGAEETKPEPRVKELYETHGQRGGKIISTSWPVPLSGESMQPPHRQAANYYKRVTGYSGLNGDFKVTMQHPKDSAPKPLVVEIDAAKARIVTIGLTGAGVMTGGSAPRAG